MDNNLTDDIAVLQHSKTGECLRERQFCIAARTGMHTIGETPICLAVLTPTFGEALAILPGPHPYYRSPLIGAWLVRSVANHPDVTPITNDQSSKLMQRVGSSHTSPPRGS